MTQKCQNCGATLKGLVCDYCGARNNIDLKKRYEVHRESSRVCPECEVFLETIVIDKKEALYIERCKHCYGLFLDFGELEALMEREITKSEKKDIALLQEVINNPRTKEAKVHYKKCPECRKMMARINYKQQSGVILDRCMHCGYWLDGGELRQIMEWAKVAGIVDFIPTLPKETITNYTSSRSAPSKMKTPYLQENDVGILSLVIDALFSKWYGL